MEKKKTSNIGIYKELFIGLVGGVGVSFQEVICCLKKEFNKQNFKVVEVILSELITDSVKGSKYENKSEIDRIKYYMDQGSNLRKKYHNNNILALLSIVKINEIRMKQKADENILYIIKSIKRPEEYETLRRIYGRNFILISVHSDMVDRKAYLAEFESNRKVPKLEKEIDELIIKDFKETKKTHIKHGQNVSSTFPKAHLFLSLKKDLSYSIKRFVDILFGHPFHTPTIDERNLFFAKGAALRSSDLSRQVGAVITDNEGDIIATGCNDVPKRGGGFYEPGDLYDKRDFTLKKDKNVIEKLKTECVRGNETNVSLS
ncbi:MAG: hypothetical protein ACYCQI_10275 [Gammaproteobacteria bacterium]